MEGFLLGAVIVAAIVVVVVYKLERRTTGALNYKREDIGSVRRILEHAEEERKKLEEKRLQLEEKVREEIKRIHDSNVGKSDEHDSGS